MIRVERERFSIGSGRAGLRTNRDAAKPTASAATTATGIALVAPTRLRTSAAMKRSSARRRESRA